MIAHGRPVAVTQILFTGANIYGFGDGMESLPWQQQCSEPLASWCHQCVAQLSALPSTSICETSCAVL